MGNRDSTPNSVQRPLFRARRRQFLRAAAAAGTLPLFGAATAQEDDEDGETEVDIVLDGDSGGWEGVEPDDISGQTNPVLSLDAGETYVLEWENADGEPHNFVIEDADENALVETEIVSGRGETQTVEFEATSEMSEYYCVVHPVSMRGDIDLGDGQEDEEDVEVGTTPGFFSEGPAVGVTTVAEGMTAPTDFAAPSGSDDRLFVTDQTGELWVVDEDGRREEPFLDVSDQMVAISDEFAGSYADPESDYDERGLLGVEFHPDYEDNGLFYLSYSAPPDENTPDGWSHVQVVSEFEAADASEEDDLPQAANPDSERRIITFQSPQYNHNSGPMAFGPDGYLYVPMGDGGGANDEMYGHVEDWYDENAGGNGQDTEETLLGGIHRLDVDADPTEHYRTDEDAPDEPEEDEGYAIPDDNPLVDEGENRPEYYSWGWRNPFGISFDQDERLIAADAGQALFEEANVVEAGGNYGWNVREGTHCFSTDNPGEPPEDCPDTTPDDVRGGEELLDPVVEYPHTYEDASVGIVIVGGHVYEGSTVPDLEGRYIFGDWTQDVARDEPLGRVFAATVPDYGETDDTDDSGEEGGEMDDDEDTTAGDDGEDTTGADEDDGTEQNGGDVAEVPTEDLWEMEELVFEGSENGNLGRFVRQFGRDRDGEVYVLVNQVGVPEGDTGEVLQLVGPEEGEDLDTDEDEETPDDEETPADDEDEDETPEDDEDETPEDGEGTPGDDEDETPEDGEGTPGDDEDETPAGDGDDEDDGDDENGTPVDE